MPSMHGWTGPLRNVNGLWIGNCVCGHGFIHDTKGRIAAAMAQHAAHRQRMHAIIHGAAEAEGWD